ncbi:hypothetical protein FTO70_03570 [Methanosarcina sp. KYL-1]|nr:hypothetical protein [Methanosarcina sp. KYL-1]
MDKTLKILLYILLIPVGLIILFYGGFAAILILSDQASYDGNELYIGSIDFDSVLAKAEASGYDTDGWIRLNETNLIEPGNVEALEERFQNGYRVHRVELYYNENTYLEFCKYDGPETIVTLFNYSHSDISTPLEPSEFPDDSWMLDMLELSLGLNETGSQEFLERLKLEGAAQQWHANLATNGSVDFPAIYAYLNQSSTKNIINSGMWNDEEFYRDGEKIGYIAYIVPEISVSSSHNFNRYTLHVSSSGFVRADILMHRASAGKKIPEEEYRAVFREMFEKLGLPVEKVDELEFEYSPSVW